MVHPSALAVSAVVLLAVLAAAALGSRRLPPAVVAVPGAAVLVLFGPVGVDAAWAAVGHLAPTVAFLVVILLLAHLAAGEGLFAWAAAVTARRAGRSPSSLLGWVVVLASLVTAVLSLDATVVLLTPVVLGIARRMGIPARPHTYATGHLANSASLLLPVSNLTNLLAFSTTGLSFGRFTALMAGPWLIAIAVENATLRRLFRADLATPVKEPVHEVPRPPVLGLTVVGLVVAGFAVGDLIGVGPVWPALAGVLVLAARQLIARRTTPGELLGAADLPFAAFVFGLGVTVLAVLDSGGHSLLASALPAGVSLLALVAVAAISAVLANVFNNLPATLALLPVAAAGGPAPVLAALIGVNIGPNLTYVGSLANLLWRRVLGRHAPDATGFSLVGLATVPAALVGATAALWLTLQV